jgi:hypothetical protein
MMRVCSQEVSGMGGATLVSHGRGGITVAEGMYLHWMDG